LASISVEHDCISFAFALTISSIALFCVSILDKLSVCDICSSVEELVDLLQSITAIFVLSPGASGRHFNKDPLVMPSTYQLWEKLRTAPKPGSVKPVFLSSILN